MSLSVQIEVEILEKVAITATTNSTLELAGTKQETRKVKLPQIYAS